jgi:hypothetical protein
LKNQNIRHVRHKSAILAAIMAKLPNILFFMLLDHLGVYCIRFFDPKNPSLESEMVFLSSIQAELSPFENSLQLYWPISRPYCPPSCFLLLYDLDVCSIVFLDPENPSLGTKIMFLFIPQAELLPFEYSILPYCEPSVKSKNHQITRDSPAKYLL